MGRTKSILQFWLNPNVKAGSDLFPNADPNSIIPRIRHPAYIIVRSRGILTACVMRLTIFRKEARFLYFNGVSTCRLLDEMNKMTILKCTMQIVRTKVVSRWYSNTCLFLRSSLENIASDFYAAIDDYNDK